MTDLERLKGLLQLGEIIEEKLSKLKGFNPLFDGVDKEILIYAQAHNSLNIELMRTKIDSIDTNLNN